MDDVISRHAAIDAVHKEFDDCIVWDESGMTTANEVERILDSVPSAQLEITLRCKDCKYGVHTGCGNTYLCVVSPEDRLEHKYDFWCAYAERRTDG